VRFSRLALVFLILNNFIVLSARGATRCIAYFTYEWTASFSFPVEGGPYEGSKIPSHVLANARHYCHQGSNKPYLVSTQVDCKLTRPFALDCLCTASYKNPSGVMVSGSRESEHEARNDAEERVRAYCGNMRYTILGVRCGKG
jgi:hypothetical protein